VPSPLSIKSLVGVVGVAKLVGAKLSKQNNNKTNNNGFFRGFMARTPKETRSENYTRLKSFSLLEKALLCV
jgi:hypothetical protein